MAAVAGASIMCNGREFDTAGNYENNSSMNHVIWHNKLSPNHLPKMYPITYSDSVGLFWDEFGQFSMIIKAQ